MVVGSSPTDGADKYIDMKLLEIHEDKVEQILRTAARQVERSFKSVWDVDEEIYSPAGRWELGVRFGPYGEVYQSRPGEEDDDHPDPVKSGFDRLGQILDNIAKQYELDPKYKTYVGGSEKGWTYLGIEEK